MATLSGHDQTSWPPPRSPTGSGPADQACSFAASGQNLPSPQTASQEEDRKMTGSFHPAHRPWIVSFGASLCCTVIRPASTGSSGPALPVAADPAPVAGAAGGPGFTSGGRRVRGRVSPAARAAGSRPGPRRPPGLGRWGFTMKIEYLHASKYGNGAMVAEEFGKQMTALGVTVDIHHIKAVSAKA